MKSLFHTVEQSKKAAVEEALLAAAERVLTKKGYEASTMRDIAREAGCSYGSLYLYFKTKDELFSSLVNTHTLHLMRQMLEIMQSTEDIVDKLRLASRTAIEYFNAHRGFFHIFLSSREGFELRLSGPGRSAFEKFKEYELSVMKKAQEVGRARTDIPAAELCAFIQDNALSAMARWSRAKQPAPIAEQIEIVWRLSSGALGVR